MTRPEADALKTYIDFMAAQTEDHERELERKAYEEAEALKNVEKEKAANTIINHQTPNVSLVCWYDTVQNCMQVDVKAWKALSDEEKKYIENFLKSREDRKPYPLGGIINQTATHASDAAYMAWGSCIGEVNTIRPQDFDEIIQRRGRLWRSGTGFNFKNIPDRLTQEGAKLFRECVENNFNREPVLSETSNDGVNWTPANTKTLKSVAHITQTHFSISDLWREFKDRQKIIEPVSGGWAIEFAQYIRNMTIEEIKCKTTAHIELVDEGAGKETRAKIEYPTLHGNYLPKEL